MVACILILQIETDFQMKANELYPTVKPKTELVKSSHQNMLLGHEHEGKYNHYGAANLTINFHRHTSQGGG